MCSFNWVASLCAMIIIFKHLLICRYIQTLKGRRRFLSKIKFGNAKEKSKAQRQAVNSVCQVRPCLFLSFSLRLHVMLWHLIWHFTRSICLVLEICSHEHLLPDHIIFTWAVVLIQGSAADIIKIAMINIYSAISEDNDTAASSSSTETRFHVLKGRCRILLQVRDVHPFLLLQFCCFFP